MSMPPLVVVVLWSAEEPNEREIVMNALDRRMTWVYLILSRSFDHQA